MGAAKSKSQGAVPLANHGPLPVDQIPYPGPSREYCLVNVNVQLKTNISFNFSAGRNVVTSDVDTYYSILSQRYQEGFSLHSFIKIPGQASMSGVFNPSVLVPFQGIFSRNAGLQQSQGYQLKVEKSMVYLHMLRAGVLFGFGAQQTGMDANISHICQTINEHASRGGRFVCMEMTGQQVSQGMGAAMQGVGAGQGTDLFFDIPTQPSPPIYTYTAVAVPIGINYTFGFQGTMDVVCDWMGNLAAYLNQGWRLADIFLAYDQNQFFHGNQGHHYAPIYSLNSIWFFEKEASRLQDPTPLYEGTTVEVYVKMKAGFGSVTSDMNLLPLLQEMGSRGWEFVCLLETPKIVSRGFTSVTTAMMAFFQRPLRHVLPGYTQHPPNAGFNVAPQPPGAEFGQPGAGLPPPPPSYSEATEQEKKEG